MFPSMPALAFIAGQNEIGVINIGGGVTPLGGTAQNPNTANSFYWTVSNDVSYAKGRHLLKTGALIEHLRTEKLTATNIRGSYTFGNVQTFLAGTPARFVGVPPGAQLERVRPNTLFGFYVQDDYRASRSPDAESGVALRVLHGAGRDGTGSTRRCGTSSPTPRSPSVRRSAGTRRSRTGRRASASHGTRAATAGPRSTAASGSITTPTARSTARSASRRSRRHSRRRRRSPTRRFQGRRR